MKIPAIFIFGCQGSGKSTQAELIRDKYKIPFFDMGQNLRDFATGQTKLAQSVKKSMLEGKLVSNEAIQEIFTNFADSTNTSKGFVADGFPRNLTQCELLAQLADSHNWQVVAINVELTKESAVKRLSSRTVVVNGKTTRRADDQPEIVAKRLVTYEQETVPILDWLSTRYQYYSVDGEPDIDGVFQQVNKIVAQYLHD